MSPPSNPLGMIRCIPFQRRIMSICSRFWIALALSVLAFGPSSAEGVNYTPTVLNNIIKIDALAKAGQQRRAEAILQSAVRKAPDEQTALPYAVALAKLQRRAPLQFHGSFNLRPSTNVTRAATGKTFNTLLGTFTIDDGGEQRSGLGLNVGAGASYRVPLNPKSTLIFGAGVAREWYDERELRQWTTNLRATVVKRAPQQTRRLGAHLFNTTYDLGRNEARASRDFSRYGVTASWSHDRKQVTRTFSTLLEYRDYVDQDMRDASFARISMSWSKPTSARGRLNWGADIERLRPKVDYQRYWGLGARVGYRHRVTKPLRVGIDASLHFRSYDIDFSAVDYNRSDRISRVGLSVTNTSLNIAGAVPTLRCSHTDHHSNIALYETSYTDCGLTFSFEF